MNIHKTFHWQTKFKTEVTLVMDAECSGLFRNPEEGQGSQKAVMPVMMMMMMMMSVQDIHA
jgi:hypothetical protein